MGWWSDEANHGHRTVSCSAHGAMRSTRLPASDAKLVFARATLMNSLVEQDSSTDSTDSTGLHVVMSLLLWTLPPRIGISRMIDRSWWPTTCPSTVLFIFPYLVHNVQDDHRDGSLRIIHQINSSHRQTICIFCTHIYVGQISSVKDYQRWPMAIA